MRRTVATLLVVASPLLLANPVSATEERAAPPSAPPAVEPAVPAPVQATPPAVPAAPTVATPAVPAPVVSAPVATAPAAPRAIRRAVKAVRATAPSSAELSDAAYAAKLQAELCQARQIFCGLGRNGRYPGS